MKERIETYMEDLFEKAPINRKVIELKEELKINALERYADLKEEGMAEEDAYKLVINSVGDIKSLLATIEMEEEKEKIMEVPNRQYAFLKAVTVAFYILSLVVFLLTINFTDGSILALVATIVFLIIPISMSVYLANMKSSYVGQNATVVEEFKAWQSDKQNKKGVRLSISVIVWCLVTISYFIVSFVTEAWEISWLLFVVGVCIEAIVSLVFSMKH